MMAEHEAERQEQRSATDPPARARRGLCVAALVGLLLAGAATHLGCSEEGRYRVLSFLFDGVPTPEERRAARSRPAKEPDAGRGGFGPRLPGGTALVSHPPYQNRKCAKCHPPDAAIEATSVNADLCRQCHKRYFEVERSDWAHGPAAAGDCSFCHKPHESEYAALLTAAEPDLCLRCHDKASVTARPYHVGAIERGCSICHDPHFSGNRLLLADARTYSRSKGRQRKIQSTHAPWKSRKCAKCHLVEKSHQLIPDVNGACKSCHQNILSALPSANLHAPVRQGKCVLCHVSHESVRPALVRTTGETICFQCHKPRDVLTPDHPRVPRVDCFLCHTGHSSTRGALLKPGVPSRHWPDAPEPEPAGRGAARTQPNANAASGRAGR